MAKNKGQNDFEQELISALNSVAPPAGLAERLTASLHEQNAPLQLAEGSESSTHTWPNSPKHSAPRSRRFFLSRGLLSSAAAVAGAGALSAGYFWLQRGKTCDELIDFCEANVIAAENVNGWQSKRMPPATANFIRENLSFNNMEPAGCYSTDGDQFGTSQDTWRIRIGHGFIFVTEIAGAQPIRELNEVLRMIRSTGTWSYAAMQSGTDVKVVASSARLQAHLQIQSA